jgi:hypothetical protein
MLNQVKPLGCSGDQEYFISMGPIAVSNPVAYRVSWIFWDRYPINGFKNTIANICKFAEKLTWLF